MLLHTGAGLHGCCVDTRGCDGFHFLTLSALLQASHKQLQKEHQGRLNEYTDRLRNTPSVDLSAQV